MQQLYQEFFETLESKNISNVEEALKLRHSLAKKYSTNKLPSLIQILLNIPEDKIENFKFLIGKPVRTISGVSPVAIMTYPRECPHGSCTFCPGGVNSFFGNVPKSYTGNEPASMRAIRNKFDPYLQVMNRLQQYILLGHIPSKIELIIMGGTFPSYPINYQDEFICYALKAINDFSDLFIKENIDLKKFKEIFMLPHNMRDLNIQEKLQRGLLKFKNNSSLEQEQLRNESSKLRCIGLAIETKPDYGKLNQGNQMLRLGATKVEVGVQSVYETPLHLTNRGHNLNDTKESLQILKDLGFKINAHYMLGLPSTDKKMDLEGLKQMFSDPDFKPDWMKIYPCMVMPGTPLYEQYKKQEYIPLTTDEAAEIISEAKRYVPKWLRITRIQRDIPTKVTIAGVDKTNLRQIVHEKLKEKGIKCNCIRCRESGRNKKASNINIYIEKYQAQKGTEFFISVEDLENDILVGYCRLRFPYQFLRPEITQNSALVREIHIYSPQVSLGKKTDISQQHRGFGLKLMKKAEEICQENGKTKILVLSGIGVKEYFSNLGYKKDSYYMSKNLY